MQLQTFMMALPIESFHWMGSCQLFNEDSVSWT